ncbi:hypothetical protein TNIN_69411 [Trichonephila inaurata madagascariensis]|uniref:Uncharacterized protein n=1 Tax=Trichonephila inaurata madagascariensis TaxID=2747483 RepID=A0A8X6YW48_9ARAC|nr:hypothetical protein TNIN_69411 [Trichonephila inaurata madagascariensis]
MYSVSRFYKKAISGLAVRVGKSSRLFIGNAANVCTRATQTERSVLMTTSLLYMQRVASSCNYSTLSSLGLTKNSNQVLPNESLCPFMQKCRFYSDEVFDYHIRLNQPFDLNDLAIQT